MAASPMLVVTLLGTSPVHAQARSPVQGPPPHALALANIGRSGLRSLLSASGSLGDLQNRAGSYRMAVQMERAREGPLRGRIDALERALSDPGLPSAARTDLVERRDAALAELGAVPRYEARYVTGTAQVEALTPFGFVGARPVFFLVRGRGHVRGGGKDGLTVFSEGASVGPVLLASERWLVGAALSVGRTDVDIAPFEGSSGTTSFGPQLNLGGILAEGWSVAAQVGHSWSHGGSTIARPGPEGPVEVRSEGWSRSPAAKAELKGRLSATARGLPLTVRPRVGGFVVTTITPATPGNSGAGPSGERETLAAVRVGASLEAAAGAWSPSLYLGWERELGDPLTELVRDSDALLMATGLSWSWTRGRRLAFEYMFLRGLEGLRRVSDFSLVVILDG